MITQSTTKALKLFFTVCSILNIGGPYSWKSSSNILIRTKSRIHYLLWLLSVCLYFIDVSHGWTYCYRNFVLKSLDESTGESAYGIIRTTWFTFSFLNTVSIILKSEEIRECLNLSLRLNDTYSATCLTEGKHKDYFAKLVKYFVISTLNEGFVFLIPVLMKPQSPLYIYHVFHRDNKPWRLWGYMPIEYYLATGSVYPVLLNVLVTVTHALITTNWLKQMVHGKNHLITRAPGSFMKMYRSLQTLMVLMTACFSVNFWPMFAAGHVLNHVYCLYMAIKLHGALPVPIHLIFTYFGVAWIFVEVLLYRLLGNISDVSNHVLKSWRDSVKSNKDRKLLLSFPALGVRVGGMYTIKRATALFVLLVVSNLTVNVILLHG